MGGGGSGEIGSGLKTAATKTFRRGAGKGGGSGEDGGACFAFDTTGDH